MCRTFPGHGRGRSRTGAVTGVGLLLAVSLLATTPPGVAEAEDHPPVTLTSTSQTSSWSGEFVAGALGLWPEVSAPEACTPDLCDTVHLDVLLPETTWQGRPGGMLVAIQSPVVDLFGHDLDLFVYAPDRTLAASSAYGFANEAAWVPNPVNGRYDVVVVPRFVASQPLVDGVMEPLRYDGFVRFDRGVTVRREGELNFGLPMKREFVAFGLTEQHPAVELLPDLVPTTPDNFHIETTAGVPPLFYAARAPEHQPSCYPEETLGLTADEPDPYRDPPLRCLRFDQGEHNVGDGPFQLNIYDTNKDRVFEVYQRIYSSDGSVRKHGPLGRVEFSEPHSHFHYFGFQQVTLHRIEDDGTLTFIKEKPDKGICPGDAEMGGFGRTDYPTSPLAYIAGASFGPSDFVISEEDPLVEVDSEDQQVICVADSHQDPNDDAEFPNEPFIEMGISVGWADVYPWFIADQYIDITGLPDGDYALLVRQVVDQDVDQRIQEKRTQNNTAIGCVRITGNLAEEIPCSSRGAPVHP